MNKRIEKKYKAVKEEVSELESSLSGALQSIHPPNDVMQRLQERIGKLEPNRIAKRISTWELSIITAGAVMSVAMLILTVARALFYFFSPQKKQRV